MIKKLLTFLSVIHTQSVEKWQAGPRVLAESKKIYSLSFSSSLSTSYSICETVFARPLNDGSQKIRETSVDRFWSKVKKGDNCWEWQAGKNQQGYGRFHRLTGEKVGARLCSKMDGAHRVAWELDNGPIPEGLIICHRCDNPGCVNPGHLYLGTYAENSRDVSIRGRIKGEKNPNAKLTLEDVAMIRKLAKKGIRQQDIADGFKISSGHVSSIVCHKLWT